MGFLCQKIADGGSAYVLFSFYVATMGQGVDDAVALYGCLVGGTIVSNKNFVFEI
jgi:hypothetical protein